MSNTVAPLTPMGCLRWHVVRHVLAELRPGSILEIGCGQGAAGTRLARVGRYVGVEPDHASCAVARRRIEPLGGTVIEGDHTAAPQDGYDLVCAFEVLEHIEDDQTALKDWVALVRPGGHLLLSVPAWQERFGPMDTLVGHFRRYSPQLLADRLTGAGLTDPRITLYGWPLGNVLEFTRNRIAARGVGEASTRSAAEGTARSGRLFQPGRMAGGAVRLATLPFRYVQRVAPARGVGIVAVARVPVG